MTLICRTCSQTKLRLFNLFNHYENSKLTSEILHECTSLEIESGDLLPLYICSECLERLIAAWCFRAMAIETDSKLRKVFGKQVLDKNPECKDYGATIVKEESSVKSEVQDPLNLENENVSLNEVVQENAIFLRENHELNLSRSPASDCNDTEVILPAMCIKQESDLTIQNTDVQQLTYGENHSTIEHNQNISNPVNNENKSLLEYKCNLHNNGLSENSIVKNVLPTETQFAEDTGSHQGGSILPLITDYVQLAIIPTPYYIVSGINETDKLNQETKQDDLEFSHSENSLLLNDPLKNNKNESNNNDDKESDKPTKVVTPEEYKKLTCHERKKLTVHCKLCNKDFKYRYYSEVHIRKHNGDLPHKCDVCGKGFLTVSHLKEHANVHSDERPFACDICGKTFKMLPVLQNHKGIHSDHRPHKCNVCNLSFRLESYLKTHMKIHMNQKDYICEICGKTFIDYRYLQSHMKFQHEDKNFLCTLCGKAYPTNSKLKWHFRRTHTNERPYACVHCDRRFKDKKVMESHVRIHTGEKPHSCKLCGKKFRQIVALRTHMRTHTGEAPYACKICPSQFKYRQDLSKHMKMHE